MLPLIEIERYRLELALGVEFEEKMGKLAELAGYEPKKGMDLVAMLWPTMDRSSEKGAVFVFGVSGAYFGVNMRMVGEDKRFVWQSLMVVSGTETGRESIMIAREVGDRTAVMEVDLEKDKRNKYDFDWKPDQGMDYEEKWRVDLLVGMGRGVKLAVVKAILAGERY